MAIYFLYLTPINLFTFQFTSTDKNLGVKGKFRPRTGYEGPDGQYRYSTTLSLTSAINGVDGNATAQPLHSWERDPVPIVQEVGGTPGDFWTGVENLDPTGIRSQDRPASRYIGYAIPALKPTSNQNLIRFQYQYVRGHKHCFMMGSVLLRRSFKPCTLFNPLKPELNSICYLLALLGAHHFLHVSRIRVKLLTFRLLM